MQFYFLMRKCIPFRIMCVVFSFLLLLLVLDHLFKNENKDEEVFLPKQSQFFVQLSGERAGSSEGVKPLELRAMLHRLNSDKIRMVHTSRFGAVTRDTTLLVVRVHTNLRSLKDLVLSLARVKYIESTLLIFSHSFYDSKINEFIESINFCNVIQIFYPYSVQANPNRFPGTRPQDCPESGDASKVTVTCFGRSARLVEQKHLWWWTAHHVFEMFEWSDVHQGLILFLEENHYVSPDLLYMLQYAQRVFSYMLYVHVIDLGVTQNSVQGAQLSQDYSTLQMQKWKPAVNATVAFNRTVWRQVVALGSQYCLYDDVSWSRSLLNVFSKFPRNHVMAVTSHIPRIISLSQGSGDDADVQLVAQGAWQRMRDSKLFPNHVRYESVWEQDPAPVKLSKTPLGGFSDIYDRLFCIHMLSVTRDGNLQDDVVDLKSQLRNKLLQQNITVNKITL